MFLEINMFPYVEGTSSHNTPFNVAPRRKEMFVGADEHARRFFADATEGSGSSNDRYEGFHACMR